MASKHKKLLQEFQGLTHNDGQEGVNLETYLKSKLGLIGEENVKGNVDWRCEFMEAYNRLKVADRVRHKMTVLFQELISQISRVVKSHDLEIQLLHNELTLTRNALQQEKNQLSRIQKEHQHTLRQQRRKTFTTLQQLQQKQFQLIELQEKLLQYEEEIQEIKSTEYQHMINSIKEEEILNSQAQTLFKENTLLKHQLKESTVMNNTLNKIITQVKTECDTIKIKYHKTKKYIKNKFISSKQMNESKKQNKFISQLKDYQVAETPINLVQFKDDFSFRDSIEYQNNSVIVPNNPPSVYNFDSSSERFYASQESPSRAFMQREILNLTDRDLSIHSRNVKHLLRSKKNLYEDKQNISQNTWDYQDFDNYQNQKLSRFGSKKNDKSQKQDPSNSSVDGILPIGRDFQTQERVSLLSKQHRRIKSSLCGKNIHEFQEQDNNHFIMNTDKFTESMIDNLGEGRNNVENESPSNGYNVNEIVINEELLSSYKQKGVEYSKDQNTVEERGTSSINMHLDMIDAKFVKSVQVRVQQIQKEIKPPTPQMDMYYAFFCLSAQCAKLNHRNFNQAISVYFNLEEEYNNVLKKMIPINKWYNYIQDQIQTSIKYQG